MVATMLMVAACATGMGEKAVRALWGGRDAAEGISSVLVKGASHALPFAAAVPVKSLYKPVLAPGLY